MDSKPGAAAAALPPEVQISFRDDLTQPELRDVAERSVATLVARSAKAVARARAAEAEDAQLIGTLNAPIAKLIEADPEAARALEHLRSHDLVHFDSIDVLSPPPPAAKKQVLNIDLMAPGATEVRVPPYDFIWSWHDEAGSAPFKQVLLPSGRVGLVARSGSGPGGASGFVKAHAGFGLILRTNRTVTAIGRSLRMMRYSYFHRSIGIGTNATSEGGMEFTALEDGQLLASATHKLWRRRTSDVESASDGEGPMAILEPSELVFTMQPGREYTFNVGTWVFSDRTPGLGVAAVQAVMEGDVLALTIQRDG